MALQAVNSTMTEWEYSRCCVCIGARMSNLVRCMGRLNLSREFIATIRKYV